MIMKTYYTVKNSSNGSMEIEVEVAQHEKIFGRDMSIITPVSGRGEMKVNSNKVIVSK